MKISHIKINNFRTFENFDEDVGQNNIIVGQNNVGKSNLLTAIDRFYHPKNLSEADLRKDCGGNFVEREFNITLNFDELTEDEQKENRSYLNQESGIKIELRGYLNDEDRLDYEYHGYIQKELFEYPSDFEQDLKTILDNNSPPKKSDINQYSELNNIVQEIQPSGKISKENWNIIRKSYGEKHQEITSRIEERLSSDLYQGFVKTRNAKRTGECIFISAEKNPSEDLINKGSRSAINQLLNHFISEIDSEEIKKQFNTFREKILNERNEKTHSLQEKFNEELELWETTVNINFRSFDMEDSIPSYVEIHFNDGILTDLERKGTGLQRYVFFKFLKILNEFNLGRSVSLILLFEEPEAHLHPHFQREMASILKDLKNISDYNYQTFITTHSSQFIDIMSLDDVFIFQKEEGCTESHNCHITLSNLKEKLKTILFFDPNISEIFFAKRILLIEGQSEEILINFLKEKGEIDTTNISIINAKSKTNIPTFLNVLNALKIPYSVLIDEDPYFLPHHKKENPEALKQRKKLYKKTKSISEKVDLSIGHLVVVSPNFDEYLGVTKTQLNKHGKPFAVFKYLKSLYNDDNRSKINPIRDLFSNLIDPHDLNYRILNHDYSQWQFKEEKSVRTSVTDFSTLKKVIQSNIRTYKAVLDEMNTEQIQEIQELFKKSSES